jgi:alkylhydroperoxidase family enzyme
MSVRYVLALILAASLCGCATSNQRLGFSPRLAVPRVEPVDMSNLTEPQRVMLESRGTLNIYKTLANHVELYNRWSPLGRFILSGSSIQPRHREMAMLRMGWLCQSGYEWSQHARIAKASAGMLAEEIRAIAVGPAAPSWSDLDRAVLRMADELRYDTMISDQTWAALRRGYSEEQIMELLFTAAQYQLVSMALNSLGVQLEPTAVERMPSDLPLPAVAQRPATPRLTQPRLPPLTPEQWSPQQKALLGARAAEGNVLNLFATTVRQPQIHEPFAAFMRHLFGATGLPPRVREMLILRTGWLWNAEYEYAHHRPLAVRAGLTEAEVDRIAQGPTAAGWSESDRAVLRAVDELRREAFISDATWAELGKDLDIKQRLDLIFTVGGYAMTALTINSFGIPIEPNLIGYPAK